MPTLARLEQALHNADAAGDTAAAKQFAAEIRAHPEYGGAKPQQREPDSVLSRIGTGIMDPVYGAAQIADRVLVNPIRQAISPGAASMEDVIRERDAEYSAPGGVDWARMGGNVLNPVSWAGGGTGVGRAVLGGAAQSVLAPTAADLDTGDFVTEKAKQAAIGGAAGGVMAKVLPRIMGGPIKPTEDAAALQRAGVTLTPGQAAGGRLGALEERAMSLPVVGDIISNARGRSLDDFQAAAINRNVVGLPKGVRSVDEANEAVSEMYQRAVPYIKPTPASRQGVQQALTDALDNPELIDSHRKILEGIHATRFKNYDQLDGPALKRLDSELGFLARKYRGPTASPSDKTLSDEIYRLQAAMREGWAAGMPEDKAWELTMANDAFRLMVPVNKAASQRPDERVMPRALQKAMAKQAGVDVSRMNPDDLVDPAVRVLGSKVPDSGTAGRLLLPGAVIGGLAAPQAALKAVLAAGGAAAAYSRAGSNILTGNTDVQRWLLTQTPAVRRAFIAALRAQQAGSGEGGAIDNSAD